MGLGEKSLVDRGVDIQSKWCAKKHMFAFGEYNLNNMSWSITNCGYHVLLDMSPHLAGGVVVGAGGGGVVVGFCWSATTTRLVLVVETCSTSEVHTTTGRVVVS